MRRSPRAGRGEGTVASCPGFCGRDGAVQSDAPDFGHLHARRPHDRIRPGVAPRLDCPQLLPPGACRAPGRGGDEMTGVTKFLGGGLVLAVAAGAMAAKPPPAAAPDDKAVVAMHAYGACIADHTRYGAEQVLAMDPNDGSAHRMLE